MFARNEKKYKMTQTRDIKKAAYDGRLEYRCVGKYEATVEWKR